MVLSSVMISKWQHFFVYSYFRPQIINLFCLNHRHRLRRQYLGLISRTFTGNEDWNLCSWQLIWLFGNNVSEGFLIWWSFGVQNLTISTVDTMAFRIMAVWSLIAKSSTRDLDWNPAFSSSVATQRFRELSKLVSRQLSSWTTWFWRQKTTQRLENREIF